MNRTLIDIEVNDYPQEFRELLTNADVYESSSSNDARVIFIDKGEGYFLKCADRGALKLEVQMTEFFHGK